MEVQGRVLRDGGGECPFGEPEHEDMAVTCAVEGERGVQRHALAFRARRGGCHAHRLEDFGNEALPGDLLFFRLGEPPYSLAQTSESYYLAPRGTHPVPEVARPQELLEAPDPARTGILIRPDVGQVQVRELHPILFPRRTSGRSHPARFSPSLPRETGT